MVETAVWAEILTEIIIESKEITPSVFHIKKKVFEIGREKGDIRLRHPKISQRHCEIRRLKNTFLVTDLNSTNGIYLDGRRLAQFKIRPGEVFVIAGIPIRLNIKKNMVPKTLEKVLAKNLKDADVPLAGFKKSFAPGTEEEKIQKMLEDNILEVLVTDED